MLPSGIVSAWGFSPVLPDLMLGAVSYPSLQAVQTATMVPFCWTQGLQLFSSERDQGSLERGRLPKPL